MLYSPVLVSSNISKESINTQRKLQVESRIAFKWRDIIAVRNRKSNLNSELLALSYKPGTDNRAHIDNVFPPEVVCSRSIDNSSGDPNFFWMRVSDYIRVCTGKEPELFGQIHVSDIIQGTGEDCWLLAVLSGMANFPNKIRSLFLTNKLSSKGVYVCYLYDMCQRCWVSVPVDDFIPMRLEPDVQLISAKLILDDKRKELSDTIQLAKSQGLLGTDAKPVSSSGPTVEDQLISFYAKRTSTKLCNSLSSVISSNDSKNEKTNLDDIPDYKSTNTYIKSNLYEQYKVQENKKSNRLLSVKPRDNQVFPAQISTKCDKKDISQDYENKLSRNSSQTRANTNKLANKEVRSSSTQNNKIQSHSNNDARSSSYNCSRNINKQNKSRCLNKRLTNNKYSSEASISTTNKANPVSSKTLEEIFLSSDPLGEEEKNLIQDTVCVKHTTCNELLIAKLPLLYRPYFCKPGNTAIWPIVLEKAMAKYLSKYTKLNGGNEEFALICLGGFSQVYVFLRPALNKEKTAAEKDLWIRGFALWIDNTEPRILHKIFDNRDKKARTIGMSRAASTGTSLGPSISQKYNCNTPNDIVYKTYYSNRAVCVKSKSTCFLTGDIKLSQEEISNLRSMKSEDALLKLKELGYYKKSPFQSKIYHKIKYQKKNVKRIIMPAASRSKHVTSITSSDYNTDKLIVDNFTVNKVIVDELEMETTSSELLLDYLNSDISKIYHATKKISNLNYSNFEILVKYTSRILILTLFVLNKFTKKRLLLPNILKYYKTILNLLDYLKYTDSKLLNLNKARRYICNGIIINSAIETMNIFKHMSIESKLISFDDINKYQDLYNKIEQFIQFTYRYRKNIPEINYNNKKIQILNNRNKIKLSNENKEIFRLKKFSFRLNNKTKNNNYFYLGLTINKKINKVNNKYFNRYNLDKYISKHNLHLVVSDHLIGNENNNLLKIDHDKYNFNQIAIKNKFYTNSDLVEIIESSKKIIDNKIILQQGQRKYNKNSSYIEKSYSCLSGIWEWIQDLGNDLTSKVVSTKNENNENSSIIANKKNQSLVIANDPNCSGTNTIRSLTPLKPSINRRKQNKNMKNEITTKMISIPTVNSDNTKLVSNNIKKVSTNQSTNEKYNSNEMIFQSKVSKNNRDQSQSNLSSLNQRNITKTQTNNILRGSQNSIDLKNKKNVFSSKCNINTTSSQKNRDIKSINSSSHSVKGGFTKLNSNKTTPNFNMSFKASVSPKNYFFSSSTEVSNNKINNSFQSFQSNSVNNRVKNSGKHHDKNSNKQYARYTVVKPVGKAPPRRRSLENQPKNVAIPSLFKTRDPTVTVKQNNTSVSNNNLFDKLERYYNSHFIMICCILKAPKSSYFRRDCLVTGHAYALLGCIKIITETFTVRLVRLRNPHGRGGCLRPSVWTGRWSDNCPLWDRYPEVACAIKFKPNPDGCFWMDFDDFADIFDKVVVLPKTMRPQLLGSVVQMDKCQHELRKCLDFGDTRNYDALVRMSIQPSYPYSKVDKTN